MKASIEKGKNHADLILITNYNQVSASVSKCSMSKMDLVASNMLLSASHESGEDGARSHKLYSHGKRTQFSSITVSTYKL